MALPLCSRVDARASAATPVRKYFIGSICAFTEICGPRLEVRPGVGSGPKVSPNCAAVSDPPGMFSIIRPTPRASQW